MQLGYREMMNSTVTVGLLQRKSETQSKENLEKALQGIEQAAGRGAQIVCLQELFLSPYFCQINNKDFFSLAQPVPDDSGAALGRAAKKFGVVVIGSFFEKDRNHFFNTAAVWDADGSFLGKYRKVHIPDDLPNFYSEKFYFTSGDLGYPIFNTRFGKIGVQVCWDQWFPEGARSLALKGAQMIFYPTAIGWPVQGLIDQGRVEHDAWLTVQRGHAIANTVFVAAANRIGVEDHLNFWGSSFVADPFGKVLAQAATDKEETLVVACDLGRIEAVRRDWPFLTCRRTESYQL
jgi:N-carbamoylputrescine amidase